jgi:hypothetical protein
MVFHKVRSKQNKASEDFLKVRNIVAKDTIIIQWHGIGPTIFQ